MKEKIKKPERPVENTLRRMYLWRKQWDKIDKLTTGRKYNMSSK